MFLSGSCYWSFRHTMYKLHTSFVTTFCSTGKAIHENSHNFYIICLYGLSPVVYINCLRRYIPETCGIKFVVKFYRGIVYLRNFLAQYSMYSTVRNFKNFKLVFLRNLFLEYFDFEMLYLGQETSYRFVLSSLITTSKNINFNVLYPKACFLRARHILSIVHCFDGEIVV